MGGQEEFDKLVGDQGSIELAGVESSSQEDNQG